MKRSGKPGTVLAASLVALALFTSYVAFDTFVIPRAYAKTTAQVQADGTEAEDGEQDTETATYTAEDTEAVNPSSLDGVTAVSAKTYTDSNTSITVTTCTWQDTTLYVADVTVSSADALKTALADGTYGKNVTETTSDIADEVNAILAVNGDFYGARDLGYVIRNGVLYRDSAASGQEDLVIYADGSFSVISEDEVMAQELLDAGAQQVLSFGPGLVENGEISVTEDEEVGKAMASNPRTAIGILSDNHYVFVVADGRTSESAGFSLYELAEFMQSLGCTTAYNLDGGGSSTMVFCGEVVNKPTTNGSTIKERKVSDIIYVG